MIKNKDENNLIVALDVGTSKIVVIVAEVTSRWCSKNYWPRATCLQRIEKRRCC